MNDHDVNKSLHHLTNGESIFDQLAFSRIAYRPIDNQYVLKSSLKRHHLMRRLHFHDQLD
jgi:hypothetical protein